MAFPDHHQSAKETLLAIEVLLQRGMANAMHHSTGLSKEAAYAEP